VKLLAVQEVRDQLPKLLGTLGREPIAITQAGKVRAALLALDELDLEAYTLARSPKFAEIIGRSRQSARREGLVSLESLEKELGLTRRGAGKKQRKRTKRP
jgi:PHD/YefM family antitoxin component YafN of YafNO toxin-antitoxin module